MIEFTKTIKFKFAAYASVIILLFGVIFVGSVNLVIRYYVHNRPAIGSMFVEVDEEDDVIQYRFPPQNKNLQLTKEAIDAINLLEAKNVERLRDVSLIALIPYSILSFAAGYFLASKYVDPINKVIYATQNIDLDSLAQRVEDPNTEDEVGKLISTFNAMLDRLQESQQVRDQFAQDASHELKTPLAVIKTNLQVINDDPSSSIDEYKNASKIVLSAIESLETLAEDLLLLTRRNSRAPKEDINLAELLEEIVNDFEPMAASKEIKLNLKAKSKKAVINANEFLLTRAIRNLIDNAIKYSDSDKEITITLEDKKKKYIIEVQDQGIGIPEKDLKNIFKRFYRVDKSRAKTRGGTGLGLSIVHDVISQHGGSVEVESKEGLGSTFTVSLPK